VEVQTAGAILHLFILMLDESSHVHAILAYAGVEVQLHLFVTSALGGSERYLHCTLRKGSHLLCPLNMRLGIPQWTVCMFLKWD